MHPSSNAPTSDAAPPLVRLILGGQAAYYILTGVWPLAHMASFEAITGPKVDDWLVKMVGLLAATVGVTLAMAVRAGRWSAEVRTLAILSALSFATIDVRYALSGRISPIYLADAAVELLLVAFLAGATVTARKSAT